jgi:putative transposase
MARAVLAGVPHHLTQRGLDRQQIFVSDADREVYLGLVRSTAARFGAELLGYCLMTNHVHWVAIPRAEESLARAFGEAHGRYAAYANARISRSGHFWQNRFFSCCLDEAHLWAALRYVERNPVRARLVDRASTFAWSSAAAHTGVVPAPGWLRSERLHSTFTPPQWAAYLEWDTIIEQEVALRRNTYTGRPAGSPEFVAWVESCLGRTLAAQPGGRPNRAAAAAVGCLPGQRGLFDAE